jgi:hypothetical protein
MVRLVHVADLSRVTCVERLRELPDVDGFSLSRPGVHASVRLHPDDTLLDVRVHPAQPEDIIEAAIHQPDPLRANVREDARSRAGIAAWPLAERLIGGAWVEKIS